MAWVGRRFHTGQYDGNDYDGAENTSRPVYFLFTCVISADKIAFAEHPHYYIGLSASAVAWTKTLDS